MSEAVVFDGDDPAYRRWIYDHPSGYVINALRGATGGEPILHTAMCDHIAPRAEAQWTTGEYIKFCGEKRVALDLFAREKYGAFPKECTNCEP